MEVEQEETTSSIPIGNEPTPLAQEGGATQLDLDIKPKPADKGTTVIYKKPNFIKDIIGRPKEGGSSDASESKEGAASQSQTQGPEKEDNQTILARLGSENKDEDSSTPPPTEEETQDYAEMIVDGVDAIFVFLAQLWSKDSDDREYQATPESKKKLKKYLAKILARAGKKYPIGWMFLGLMVVCYFPLAKKAHAHRKMVDEERAKDEPNVTVLSGDPKRRRRRKSSASDNREPQYYPSEELK